MLIRGEGESQPQRVGNETIFPRGLDGLVCLIISINKGGEGMKTVKELSKKYGLNTQTIARWCRDKRVICRKEDKWYIDEQSFVNTLKYYYDIRNHMSFSVGYDRNIFQNIDTPEKAYWLGFIEADGCLHWTNEKHTQGYLSIDISERDVDHLKKFESFIHAQENMIHKTIHPETGNGLSHIRCSGKCLLQDLNKLGIQANKSEREVYIKTNFDRDFIRGYLDGDGYIRKNLHSIGFVGGYDILYNIQQVFLRELNVAPKKIGKHGTIFRIEYTAKEDKLKIANWLYYDNSICLDRKKELADQIKKLR